ncbi:MAG: hypothetical protein RLZZ628_4424 [Bacteroidota bacterium]|jgi:hypothetical protein
MKHLFAFVVLFVGICSFKTANSTVNVLFKKHYGPTVTMKVSELRLLYSEPEIIAHSSYAKIKALSDASLKQACSTPLDGDYVTIKNGTVVIMQGNPRIYEMKRRGFLDFVVTCDVFTPAPLLKSCGLY